MIVAHSRPECLLPSKFRTHNLASYQFFVLAFTNGKPNLTARMRDPRPGLVKFVTSLARSCGCGIKN